jgi:PilZ domain
MGLTIGGRRRKFASGSQAIQGAVYRRFKAVDSLQGAVNSMSATRFHPRTGANFVVSLLTGGKAVATRAIDVSMAGLQLLGRFQPFNEAVTLSLQLPEGKEIVTRATVKRQTEEAVALEFEQLDWDDLLALARFVHPRI